MFSLRGIFLNEKMWVSPAEKGVKCKKKCCFLNEILDLMSLILLQLFSTVLIKI